MSHQQSPLLDELAGQLSSVVLPVDADYAKLATPWNLAVPSTPLAVVAAADAGEVSRTLRFATAHRIPVAVQCTGHGASADLSDAILLDTRRLDECTVHAEERWARVGAGVVWQRVLDAAAPHGLAALAGSSPGVGVVGYTTGGGHGPLARTHGLAADRVRAIEVVTGEGHLLRATATEHPDLFWGLRGGKGTLGIVTAIEFDLLPIPELYAGALYFDGADAADVVPAWSRWCSELPTEGTTSIALLQLPPMPGVPEPLAGRLTVAVRYAWTGDPAQGAELLATMRGAAPLVIDGVGMMPYAALGRIHSDPVDPLPSHEGHALLAGFPAEAAERLVAAAGPGSGSPQVVVEVRQLGGAVATGGDTPSAFSRRDAAFSLFSVGIAAPPLGQAVAAHATALREAMSPWTAPGALPNFAPGVDAERFRRAYTPEVLERLGSLSAMYDPAGVLVAGRGLAAPGR
jgi:FAD/FMN-containing dehydrogenase